MTIDYILGSIFWIAILGAILMTSPLADVFFSVMVRLQ